MVFINRKTELIELLSKCSREEIGISLMAYELALSHGEKIKNSDIKILEKAFDYHDERYSNCFPSLLNDNLQNIEKLICESQKDFVDNNYSYTLELEDVGLDKIQFQLYIKEKKNGIFITEIPLSIKLDNIDKIKSEDLKSDKTFVVVDKAIKHIKNKIVTKEIDIEKFLSKTLSI